MSKVLKDLPLAIAYLDGIIIYSKMTEEPGEISTTGVPQTLGH